MSKLVVEHVSKSFDGVPILEDVSLRLEEGELVCLLGVSGAGKTTLFNIISGLMDPEEGKVYLSGEEITGKAGKISYMLQKDLLLPYRTVLGNVALPLLIRGVKKEEAYAEAARHFGEFGLAGTEHRYPSQLSGGMRQRFSALDTITKGAIHTWYLEVMERIRLSTLFITHDIDEAILLSDRIYILSGKPGRIVAELAIREPKPRSAQFPLTGEFLQYKREIIRLLELPH